MIYSVFYLGVPYRSGFPLLSFCSYLSKRITAAILNAGHLVVIKSPAFFRSTSKVPETLEVDRKEIIWFYRLVSHQTKGCFKELVTICQLLNPKLNILFRLEKPYRKITTSKVPKTLEVYPPLRILP